MESHRKIVGGARLASEADAVAILGYMAKTSHIGRLSATVQENRHVAAATRRFSASVFRR